MPRTEAKIKCLGCNNEFEAISGEFTKCECGKTEVNPSQYSTSYRNHGVQFKTLSSNTYYFKEDFFELDDHLMSLYEKIKILAKELKFFVHEMIEKGKEEERFLDVISISGTQSTGNSYEYNAIKFYCRLGKTYSNPKYEDIEERFVRFLNFLEKVKSAEIKLSDRKFMLNYAEELDLYWNREQVEMYDYTFSF